MTTVTYHRYRRSHVIEAADWTPGFDMTDVAINPLDTAGGSPRLGDKILRNPVNHADRWLIGGAYFRANFEPIEETLN